MRITDYEGGKSLSDVSIMLTREEARDLAAYLKRLLEEPEIGKAYLSEVSGTRLEKELTILIEQRRESGIAPFRPEASVA